MQETQVQSLGQEDLLEKEMATHSSIFAWESSWTEEAGGLQSVRVSKSQTWLSYYPRAAVKWSAKGLFKWKTISPHLARKLIFFRTGSLFICFLIFFFLSDAHLLLRILNCCIWRQVIRYHETLNDFYFTAFCALTHISNCRGPAPVNPGNSKQGQSRQGKTYLLRNIKRD